MKPNNFSICDEAWKLWMAYENAANSGNQDAMDRAMRAYDKHRQNCQSSECRAQREHEQAPEVSWA